MIHDYLEGRGIGHRFFGSFTKGRFHAGSDIDLLIEGEVDADARASLERRISEIADPLGIPVDILYSDDIGERNIEVLLGH